MRIAIVGSRSATNKEEVYTKIAAMFDKLGYQKGVTNLTLISGGAKGVDTFVKEFADDFKLDFICFEPYFVVDKDSDYTPRHFFTRNRQIVNNSDVVIAMTKGQSNGTLHTYNYAKKKGMPCFLIELEEEGVKDNG